jgi:multidrug efflux pump subunit AcrB
MTLGGLALAVGILVDESTVVMENIHSHLDQGRGRALAVLEASKEVQIPRLLAMFCVLAVFVPSFFMVGVARSLFVPLSLAVGFAMAASYLLSSSLVPVLSTWILRDARNKQEKKSPSLLDRLRRKLGYTLEKLTGNRRLVVSMYVVAALLVIGLVPAFPNNAATNRDYCLPPQCAAHHRIHPSRTSSCSESRSPDTKTDCRWEY